MAYVISDDCIACGTCIDECPVEAISEGDIYSIDPEICTECGTCADACPTSAISPGDWPVPMVYTESNKDAEEIPWDFPASFYC